MIVNLSRLGKSGTGMWQYSTNFLDTLSKVGMLSGIVCSKEHEERLHSYNVELVLVPEWVANTSRVSRFRPLLWFVYSFWLALRLLIRSDKQTVVSTTHHVLPFLRNQVITIHDLRPYDYPDSRLQWVYFHWLLPRALWRCRHVLTVSGTAQSKISQYFDYPSDKISVIYNAIDTSAFTACHDKENYLLAVGASWRHKRIDALLNVSALWALEYRLVIVAGRTDYVEELKTYVLKNNLEHKVSFRHEVSFSELIHLYQHASALVYPSRDEGFGIPPVESLSCLTPVIVSDIPVFHEVLSDAAIYVQPDEPESWRDAFSMLSSPLLRSAEWKAKAMACANKYNRNLMSGMVSNWLMRMMP